MARGSFHANEIGWARGKNYSTQISNQADLKMYKTSKMNYLQYINFRMELHDLQKQQANDSYC